MKKRRTKKRFYKALKIPVTIAVMYVLHLYKDRWILYAKNAGIIVLLTAAGLFLFFSIKRISHQTKRRKEYFMFLSSDIRNVDKLTGFEFERYLRAHFKNKGYRVFLTPEQHDYGVDLVIQKGTDRIAVQAKRYNHEQGYKVTYKAVQEVAAGKAYYKCNKGIVITNSFFTKSARKLAECNNIDLWDRYRMIEEFQALNAPDIRSYKSMSKNSLLQS